MEQKFHMNNAIPTTARYVFYVRCYQIVASVLELILCSYALSYYWASASLVFTLFHCIWSLFFCLSVILVPIILPFLYFKFLHLIAECLTWLFWLAAWATLASWSATWDDDYYGGSHSSGWGAVTAAAIFGCFTWLSFCITLANFSWAVHRYRVGSEGTEMAEVTGAPQEQQQAQTVPV